MALSDLPTLCHVCRYIRPRWTMRVDETTRTLLHSDESCTLPGGLYVCDEQHVKCGSEEYATGRMLRGLKWEGL